MHFLRARQTAGPEGDELVHTHVREKNAERASGEAQHAAFREALAHQTAAAGAERGAHG